VHVLCAGGSELTTDVDMDVSIIVDRTLRLHRGQLVSQLADLVAFLPA